ncbi:MAG: hypothetical protein HC860_24255, partial [Alkalinema sp. RU_4_3]|nr:hypothetical protein [Alkalinema sp. RU_4_3]
MSKPKKSGWSLGDIPLSFLLLIAGAGYWWLIHLGNFNRLWTQAQTYLPQTSLTPQSSPAPLAQPPSNGIAPTPNADPTHQNL